MLEPGVNGTRYLMKLKPRALFSSTIIYIMCQQIAFHLFRKLDGGAIKTLGGTIEFNSLAGYRIWQFVLT